MARNGSDLKVIVICAALLAALGPQRAAAQNAAEAATTRRAIPAEKAHAAQEDRREQHTQAARNAGNRQASAQALANRPPTPEYVNRNPKATPNEQKIGKILNDKAAAGRLYRVSRVEGAPEPGGDYLFIDGKGGTTRADLRETEVTDADKIEGKIYEKSGQKGVTVAVLELRGEAAKLPASQATAIAREALRTPGHSIQRVIFIKGGKVIGDVHIQAQRTNSGTIAEAGNDTPAPRGRAPSQSHNATPTESVEAPEQREEIGETKLAHEPKPPRPSFVDEPKPPVGEPKPPRPSLWDEIKSNWDELKPDWNRWSKATPAFEGEAPPDLSVVGDIPILGVGSELPPRYDWVRGDHSYDAIEDHRASVAKNSAPTPPPTPTSKKEMRGDHSYDAIENHRAGAAKKPAPTPPPTPTSKKAL